MRLQNHIVNPGQRQGFLFLHGFLGDSREFRQVGRIFEKTHTVIYADLPGHGKSRIDKSDTIEDIVSNYQSLLQNQVTRRWHVVGYSMGGRIALLLAAQCPTLVHKLTLISSSPGLENKDERRKRAQGDQALAKQIRRMSMRSFLSFWYCQSLFQSFSQSRSFGNALSRRRDSDPAQLSVAIDVMSVGRQPSLWSKVSFLRMPIEVICGQKDRKFCQIAKRMQERNPAIEVTLVAESGHVVHLEAERLVKERLHNGYRRMESC